MIHDNNYIENGNFSLTCYTNNETNSYENGTYTFIYYTKKNHQHFGDATRTLVELTKKNYQKKFEVEVSRKYELSSGKIIREGCFCYQDIYNIKYYDLCKQRHPNPFHKDEDELFVPVYHPLLNKHPDLMQPYLVDPKGRVTKMIDYSFFKHEK